MAFIRVASLTTFWLAGACTVPTQAEFSAYPELSRAMRELTAEQRRFQAATPLPQKFDYPGNGRVTVRQIGLEGYPGNSYVRARWTYQNNTGRPVLRALIGLDVLDPDGRLVASKVSVCIFPSPRPIYDGTFYADELRTQTHDVHLQPGWSWRITCRAEYFDDFDEPPTRLR